MKKVLFLALLATAAWSTDFSQMSTEELLSMRGSVSSEDRTEFKAEMQKRMQSLSQEERQELMQSHGGGKGMGKGQGKGRM